MTKALYAADEAKAAKKAATKKAALEEKNANKQADAKESNTASSDGKGGKRQLSNNFLRGSRALK